MRPIHPLLPLAALFAGANIAPAQDLHRALVDADAIVVARAVGKHPFGEDLTLHRLQVLRDVRGAAGNQAITVLDWPKLSLHNRPTPRQSRLYCLEDATAVAQRLGLPDAEGPYFKMTGWAGSNPLVAQDVENDPVVRFAGLLASADQGAAPETTANALVAMALEPTPARLEATHYLVQRADLRAKLDGLQWNQLLARATAEVDDVGYKIALARLCAEQRLDGVFESLLVSVGPVTDPEYARCVGRIGHVLHGERATPMVLERLRQCGQERDRRMLLLTLGASNTESAADALLQMDRREPAVEAALQEHRSPRAKAAVARRR